MEGNTLYHKKTTSTSDSVRVAVEAENFYHDRLIDQGRVEPTHGKMSTQLIFFYNS